MNIESLETKLDLSRLFRASLYLKAGSGSGAPIAFIEADSHEEAYLKAVVLVTVLDGCTLAEGRNRVLAIKAATHYVLVGRSEDARLRLFEIGDGNSIYARQALFLMATPGPLTRMWASIPAETGPQALARLGGST